MFSVTSCKVLHCTIPNIRWKCWETSVIGDKGITYSVSAAEVINHEQLHEGARTPGQNTLTSLLVSVFFCVCCSVYTSNMTAKNEDLKLFVKQMQQTARIVFSQTFLAAQCGEDTRDIRESSVVSPPEKKSLWKRRKIVKSEVLTMENEKKKYNLKF